MTCIRLENISKKYPMVQALHQVSLSFRSGEIHGIMGENGAGKTTLMNILDGLVPPDDGSIYVDDQRLYPYDGKLAAKLGIAMVHQHFALVPEMTVTENILLAGHRKGLWLSRKAAAGEIRGLCAAYGLEVDPNARVSQLSVGQRQRVELMKALYKQCRVLILDEPTAVLTDKEREKLFHILSRLAGEGCAVIIISHKAEEIFSVCHRITVLRKGCVAGTWEREQTTPMQLVEVMLGDFGAAANPELQKSLPRPSHMPVFKAKGLSAWSEDGSLAVKEVSFCVNAGEIFGIGGVDGNGQKELAQAVAKQLGPSRCAYIPGDCQKDGLVGDMTLEENLVLSTFLGADFGRGPWLSWKKVRQRAVKAIGDMDIRAYSAKQTVKTLSGGNQQKLVAARELGKLCTAEGNSPRLLVAVYPTRGLDRRAAAHVHKKLLQACADGCGILLISTDLDELMALSDHLAVLYKGRFFKVFENIKDRADKRRLREEMAAAFGGLEV